MSKDSDASRTQIILGVLGFLGVLLTVLATIFAPIIQKRFEANQATQTPIDIVASVTPAPIIPTDTVPPGADTSTPAPTNTPEPTFTFTPVPLVLGQDWIQGCISTLWKAYPPTVPVIDNGAGCWKNPVHVFGASGGSLLFLTERSGNGSEEVYGLFAPLLESGEVTVKVFLKDLSNVDMWLGVFGNPDITSDGLLLTIPEGNTNKRPIAQKDITTYETLQLTQSIDQGDGYIFTFRFTFNSVSGAVNTNAFVTTPVSLASSQKWLFIGYKGLAGSYRAEGGFFGFVLK